MLTDEMKGILTGAEKRGWVTEPEALRLFSVIGLPVPKFHLAKIPYEAIEYGRDIGYPVVAKVVSPLVVHKSEANGVITGIRDDKALIAAYEQLSAIEGFEGIVIEEHLRGVEMIVGAKIDDQFGPVVLFGLGGTATEIYHDVVLRLTPLNEMDVESMIHCLKGRSLLEGFRGADPVNRQVLGAMLISFSQLVGELEQYIESIDLNPVIANSQSCTIADARIILKK